jgi:uncharacterized tellurite resistance protein B-like protein
MVIKRLKQFFTSSGDKPLDTKDDDSALRIQLATCVLLLEVAHSDDEFTVEEGQHIVEIMKAKFDLSAEYVIDLMKLALDERKESVDLWQFTNEIDNNYSPAEKELVLETLWEVIFADDELHPREEYIVRRITRLLNLTHSQFIEAKLKVKNRK